MIAKYCLAFRGILFLCVWIINFCRAFFAGSMNGWRCCCSSDYIWKANSATSQKKWKNLMSRLSMKFFLFGLKGSRDNTINLQWTTTTMRGANKGRLDEAHKSLYFQKRPKVPMKARNLKTKFNEIVFVKFFFFGVGLSGHVFHLLSHVASSM